MQSAALRLSLLSHTRTRSVGLRLAHRLPPRASRTPQPLASPPAAPPAPALRAPSAPARCVAAAAAAATDGGPRAFSAAGSEVYANVRRARALGISGVALGQGCFWAPAVYVSSTAADALLSPVWMLGGAGLSVLFAGMVHMYLRRSVAKIVVRGADASQILVSTYAFGGFVRRPDEIDVDRLVGGPKGADDNERHWTFGVKASKDSGAAYYLVDMKRGVLDKSAVAAICSTTYGGESLAILAHRRRAGDFKGRWQDWQHAKGSDENRPRPQS